VKLDLSNPAWQQTLPPGRSVAADAPAAACAFSKDGSTVAFALGDGRVRLLAADINAAETPAAERTSHIQGSLMTIVAKPKSVRNTPSFRSNQQQARAVPTAARDCASESANRWAQFPK